ncbi:PSD1 and planctomycete cytochrome C domain-containing protein [Arcticibacterium luteifluviistationis]|uniref:Cytochrome c domain-containing protein n=1 Tax=Arcticibacterium luteifluviistationis TaxID=1784714 RepID=A0A2Z4GHY0_9BACT|nr:PSD1 and planctomycete cytochrome C domain-containing protein [Arcticibacterium luteifluviistationis]AWW00911.1 hypothetical protein DJ013_13625 [Arcticibacterium luteifluviistationis]
MLNFILLFLKESAQSSEPFWLFSFLGRLHPMLVHFPISLLILAALFELLSLRNFNSKLRPSINLILTLGAASAIFSAAFGLLLAQNESLDGDVLFLHQWAGITTSVLAIVLLILLHQIQRKSQLKFILPYRVVLLLSVIGVSIAGHFGASMTHGETYLTEVLPGQNANYSSSDGNYDLIAFQADTLSEANQLKLTNEVRAIFAHNCYKCHGSAKQKGELRLDEKAFVFEGGESGKVIIPGNAKKSDLYQRITLPKGHDDVMPSKGKTLTGKEIALIELWINKGAIWPDGALQSSIFRVAELAPRNPALPVKSENLSNPIDLWVNEYFTKNEIPWAQPVDDRTYLRRIYLDIIGLIPSNVDLTSFMADTRPNKREIWVQKLLESNDSYAQHWLTFWNDALRNDYTGTGYITGGRYNLTDWLYKSLRQNKPYNAFVKELLNPDDASKGFIAGIQWRGTVNASQRTEMQAAQNVGQVLLGLNLKCASCHDSFVSDWKLEDAYAFANIFSEKPLEMNRCEIPMGKFAPTRLLWPSLGEIDGTANRAEKLKQLSEKMVQPANGRLYRTIVNRVWKQMLGRGVVEPVDEMDNEPWSQDLLDWLAVDFVNKGYDVKKLIYLISTSKVYQMPSQSFENSGLLVDDAYKFKGTTRKRMTAEQFSDAVSQLFAPVFKVDQVKYEPFELVAYLPAEKKARASLVQNNPFLTALGRPNREVVSTSRDSQGNLLQALEMTNGELLNQTLKEGAKNWKERYPDSNTLISEMFNQALARNPSQKELAIAKESLGTKPSIESIQDFMWSVVLLPEFQIVY